MSITVAACGGSEPEVPVPIDSAAQGVAIQEIAFYQSLKRTVVKDGKAVGSRIPLIAERDTLIRVFYKTDSTYDKKEVTARLTIKGQKPIDVKATLGGASADATLASTINFYPAKKLITDPLEYSIEILQLRLEPTNNPKARYPATGLTKLAVQGKRNVLRIMMVPFRYKADGSNRLPDTSKQQMEAIRRRFLQLYPVSDVQLTLHKPIDWSGVLLGNGTGWQQVGFRLLQVRNASKVPEDTYLYGFFNPAANLRAFCGFGCLLGVTLLNDRPADKGQVTLRIALGVGFNGRAANTAAHEIGHSHGRKHANCGPGLQGQSIDQTYPRDAAHSGGKIGVWGFDYYAKKLIAPTHTDIMGYCPTQWISDHNFTALWNRGKNVNLASWNVPAGGIDYDVISVDGAGRATWATTFKRRLPLDSGNAVKVVLDDDTTTRGEFFRFDHLPGGWLFVPKTGARRARFLHQGRMHEADRFARP